MNKTPFNFSDISERYKNKYLSKPIIILKYIGQAGFITFILSFIIINANGGASSGSTLLDAVTTIGGYGIVVGIICLIIVGLSVMGIKNTFTKIFLYMFLPAIIITAILTVIFILPRQ